MKNAIAICFFACTIAVTSAAIGQQALHEQIDSLLSSSFVGPDVGRADDATFLRRIHLDFTGRVPTIEQTRQFLADTSEDKRARKVDELLSTSDFSRHLAVTLDVMMMERRASKHVKADEWRTFLYSAVKENRPLNELAAQILAADGVDPVMRPAAKFYLDREGEANLLTRDVGRVFFGVDLQCAQCHDHPLIESYFQMDYYGLNSFFNRGYIFADKEKKLSFYAEKTEGITAFKSVFTEEEGTAGPFVPGGFEVIEPIHKSTEAYSVAPAANVMPIPKFSRRHQLGELVRSGQSDAFNRNMANRFWASMFGQGLVNPVDLHHDDNPPVHAPLLELLAAEFAGTLKFDMRAFLRELALTEAYQRAFEPPEQFELPAEKLQERLTTLEKQLAGIEAETEAFEAELIVERKAALAVRDEFRAAKKAVVESLTKHTATVAALTKANAAKAPVEAAVNKNRAIAEGLAASLKSAQAAKELLDDAELVAALSILDKRAKAAQAAVDKQLPDLKAKTAASTKAQAATDAASLAVDTLRVAHDAVAPKLKAAQSQLAPFTAKDNDMDRRRKLVQRQLDGTRLTISLQTTRADIAQKEAALVNIAAEQKQLEPNMEQMRKEMDQFQTQLSKMNVAHTASEVKLRVATESLQKKQAATKLVVAARQQFKESIAQLTESQNVQANAALLKSYDTVVERLTTELKQEETATAALTTVKTGLAQQVKTAESNLQTGQKRLEVLQVSSSSLTKKQTEVNAELDVMRATVSEQEEQSIDRWSEQASLATLTPLTPEEMGWSILVATGMIDNQRNAAFAALKKAATDAATKAKQPVPGDDWKPDPLALELAIHAKFEAAIAGFIPLFGSGPGQPQNEFFATVDQALFVANGGTINSWLNPSGTNLTARLDKLLEQPDAYADELYLSILTRAATAAEKQSVTEYLATAKVEDRTKQVSRELAWALLAAVEFRFNH
jgi:hypothetical protein